MDAVIFQLDKEGRFTFLGPMWAALSGQRVEDSVGRPLRDAVLAEDQSALQGLLDALTARTQSSVRGELRLQRSGAPVKVHLEAHRSPSGEVLGTLTDITEREQLQERILAADRMTTLGLLTPGLAHEMNNPLAFMLANLDFLMGEVKEGGDADQVAEWREVLGEVREGADRLRQILGNIKEFTRGDNTEEPVDLNRVLESVVRLTHSVFRSRAKVLNEFGPRAIVHGNEAALRQVFLNLALRAGNAFPEGRPENHLVRLVTREEGGSVVVEVHDNGTPIPAEHLPHLFNPFFSPPGQGPGPLLAVCEVVVRKASGSLSVSSQPGSTVFRVTMPAAVL